VLQKFQIMVLMSRVSNNWVILVTLIFALLLNLIPYPQWIQHAKPDSVTIALFYWCMYIPHRINVGFAWLTGLMMDILYYSLLGQHAVGKALVALITVVTHRRVRMYYLWQQCVMIFIISCIDLAFVILIYHLTNDIEIKAMYWLSALTTALVWPIIYLLLKFIRQKAGIS